MEGLPPERLALVVSVGLVLGVFPVIGFPTVFCLLAAAGLRLNPLALQLLNNISSPLQLALLLPLERVGECLCGGSPSACGPAAGKLGLAALNAVAGWACICIPAGVFLYFVLVCALHARPSGSAGAGLNTPAANVSGM